MVIDGPMVIMILNGSMVRMVNFQATTGKTVKNVCFTTALSTYKIDSMSSSYSTVLWVSL